MVDESSPKTAASATLDVLRPNDARRNFAKATFLTYLLPRPAALVKMIRMPPARVGLAATPKQTPFLTN